MVILTQVEWKNELMISINRPLIPFNWPKSIFAFPFFSSFTVQFTFGNCPKTEDTETMEKVVFVWAKDRERQTKIVKREAMRNKQKERERKAVRVKYSISQRERKKNRFVGQHLIWNKKEILPPLSFTLFVECWMQAMFRLLPSHC